MVAILEGHGVSDLEVCRHDESNRRISKPFSSNANAVPNRSAVWERYKTFRQVERLYRAQIDAVRAAEQPNMLRRFVL